MGFLEVNGVCKFFGGLRAVDEVSFSMQQGEILGIIGPNGAGKTTLFNLISGFLPPSAGEIFFCGTRINGMKSFEVARLGIGRTFQLVRPFKGLSVADNVLAGCGCAIYGRLLALFSRAKDPRHLATTAECLEMVGLRELQDREAEHLPLGMLRRLEIARALALRPKLILLDESFSGLSKEEELALMAVVRRLREGGFSILIIEHNMGVATNLCDRLIVLNYGRKLMEGKPEEVVADPRVISAYLGEESSA